MYIGKFQPDKGDCFILDDKYYIKSDFIYFKDHYKKASWEFEMSGLESGNTIIRIYPNIFGIFFITPLIDFIVNYKINEKGYSVSMHHVFVKENGAFLFPARAVQERPKSHCILEKGYNFLGEMLSY